MEGGECEVGIVMFVRREADVAGFEVNSQCSMYP